MFRRSRSHVVNDTNVICYVIRPGWLIFVGGRAELSCQPPPSKLLVAVHMTEKTAATFFNFVFAPIQPQNNSRLVRLVLAPVDRSLAVTVL